MLCKVRLCFAQLGQKDNFYFLEKFISEKRHAKAYCLKQCSVNVLVCQVRLGQVSLSQVRLGKVRLGQDICSKKFNLKISNHLGKRHTEASKTSYVNVLLGLVNYVLYGCDMQCYVRLGYVWFSQARKKIFICWKNSTLEKGTQKLTV